MNKGDLIELAATDSGASRAEAGRVLDAILARIQKELQEGGQVSILGFGTFSVKNRAERKGINPRTGEQITINASRVPSFKPGKGFKDAVAADDVETTA